MAGMWTCPRCGAEWPEEFEQCVNCAGAPAAETPEPPAAEAPAPEPDSAAVPEPARQDPALLPEPPPPAPEPPPPPVALLPGPPVWGAFRPFGDLFTGAFRQFASHWGWLLRVAMLVTMPAAVSLVWTFQAWADYHSARFQARIFRDLPMINAKEPSLDSLVPAVAVTVALGLLGTAFWNAALYGTMAAVGRGRRPTVGLALDCGVRGCLTSLFTSFWILLRLLPWFLLFIVPGILKWVAWSLALPARLSGEAASAEEAIRMSTQATRGERLYLFGYLLLMHVIANGASEMLSPVLLPISMVLGIGGVMVVLLLTAVVWQLLGSIAMFGLWLAWADSIATWNPGSPAATFSATRKNKAPGV